MKNLREVRLAWWPLLSALALGGSLPSCVTELRDAAQEGLYTFVTDTTILVLDNTFPPDDSGS